MMFWLLLYVTQCVIFGFACRYLANEKGKNPDTWFWMGILLGLLGLLLIGFSRDERYMAGTHHAPEPHKAPQPQTTTREAPAIDQVLKKQGTSRATGLAECPIRRVDLNCPVDIATVKVGTNNQGEAVALAISFANMGQARLTAMRMVVSCYDAFGDPIAPPPSNDVALAAQDLNVRPGAAMADYSIQLPASPQTRSAEVRVVKLAFADGTIWDAAGDLVLLPRIVVPDGLGLANLRKLAGSGASNFSAENDACWVCTCGRANYKHAGQCARCGNSKETVLPRCRDMDTVEAALEAVKASEADAERNRQRQLEEARAARKEQLLRRCLSKRTMTAVAAAMIILLAVGIGLATEWTFSYGHWQALSWSKLDKLGNTALHTAIIKGDMDKALTMIERGAALNIPNEDGFTPLVLASRQGMLQAVEELLGKGLDVNSTAKGWTAVMHAADQGHNDVVELLLNNGATPAPIESLAFEQRQVQIDRDETVQLKYAVTPSYATDKDLSWASSDDTVASVDTSGVVTAHRGGRAIITAVTPDGKHRASCEATVYVAVDSIALNKSEVTLKGRGASFTLVGAISPSDASNKEIVWSTSDDRVVTVAKGVIKSASPGSATVIAKTVEGNKVAECKVTVLLVAVTGISMDNTITLQVGGPSVRLDARVLPSDANNTSVNWSSNTPSIEVTSSGEVIPLTEGSATVKATTVDGGYSASCNVTVKPSSTSGSSYTFIWPVVGTITQGYGPDASGAFHNGIDIAAPKGTVVKAIAAGVVEFSGWKEGHGYAVIIDHGRGMRSLYAHAIKLYVGKGDRVFAGQSIAAVGSSGDATSPLLHFEITINGKNVNPLSYLI